MLYLAYYYSFILKQVIPDTPLFELRITGLLCICVQVNKVVVEQGEEF